MKRILVILLLIVLCGIGVFSFFRFVRKTPAETPAPAPGTTAELTEEEKNDRRREAEQFKRVVAADADFDGLSDTEEAGYGTNPSLADSDGDGILDNDENTVYRTDPVNPDTDGDGYQDGFEVRGGYNPLGKGKIIF